MDLVIRLWNLFPGGEITLSPKMSHAVFCSLIASTCIYKILMSSEPNCSQEALNKRRKQYYWAIPIYCKNRLSIKYTRNLRFMNKIAIQRENSWRDGVSTAEKIGMKWARAQATANDDFPAKTRSTYNVDRVHRIAIAKLIKFDNWR